MATTYRRRHNLVYGTLGAALTTGSTSITFAAALKEGGPSGTNIATLGTDEFLPLTIEDEVVYLTAYTSGGTTGTIQRGKEGTSDPGVSHANGVAFRNAPTRNEWPTAKGGIVLGSGTNQTVEKAVGSNGTVLTADSTVDGGAKWATPAGGVTHSYLGKNAVGASTETMVQWKHYTKKITLAADGLLASIHAYVNGLSSNAENLHFGLWADTSGSPRDLIGFGGSHTGSAGLYLQNAVADGPARWLSCGFGRWLTAGDYWIGVMSGGASALKLYYDTGGSDKIWTSTIDDLTDGGTVFAITDSTRDFSIRADILT